MKMFYCLTSVLISLPVFASDGLWQNLTRVNQRNDALTQQMWNNMVQMSNRHKNTAIPQPNPQSTVPTGYIDIDALMDLLQAQGVTGAAFDQKVIEAQKFNASLDALGQ